MTTMKRWLPGILLMGLASSSGAEGPTITLKGKLEGGMMGIGGESTGFALKDVLLEVDASAVEEAADLAGQAVYVQGTLELKQYLERGATWIFRASAIQAVSSGPPPAPQAPGSSAADPDLKSRALELLRQDPEFRAEARRLLAKLPENQ